MSHCVCRCMQSLLVGLAAWGCASAMAAAWQVCDLRVQVLEHVQDTRTLSVRVLESQPQGLAVCSPPGTLMGFRPETADYQSELPRRQWPKPGSTVTVRHRYLDGACKHLGACRIQHYSPLLR